MYTIYIKLIVFITGTEWDHFQLYSYSNDIFGTKTAFPAFAGLWDFLLYAFDNIITSINFFSWIFFWPLPQSWLIWPRLTKIEKKITVCPFLLENPKIWEIPIIWEMGKTLICWFLESYAMDFYFEGSSEISTLCWSFWV